MGWDRSVIGPEPQPPRLNGQFAPPVSETKVATRWNCCSAAGSASTGVRWKRQGGAAEIVGSSRSNL